MSEYAIDSSQPNESAPATPHPPVPQPPRQRRKARAGGPLLWVMVLLSLIGLGAAGTVAVLLYNERDYSQRIYPHISVRGLDIGDRSVSAARSALERRYADFRRNPVELTYGGASWHPTADELGITLDFDGALRAAAAVGRGDSRVENVRTVAATWEQGVELPLRVQVDKTAIQRYLLTVAQTLEQAPRNAAVNLDGANVVVTPEQFGMQVLVDDTMHDILAAVQHVAPQQVAIRTRTLAPPLRDADVAPIADEARTILNGPLRLHYDDKHWEWSPEHIAHWITLHQTNTIDGRPAISLLLDQAGIRRALVPIAADLKQDGALPRVDWNDGDMRITQPGTEGLGLDAASALASIDAGLRGGARSIELPLTSLPPRVTETNLAALGISEPIGIGVSSFRASEGYRITNIVAGARRMHGILLPPDAAFSFNDSLGVVDASGGFVQGYAIVDNRTQKEWGGGLCQVSTTMFRAAFWSGLPITERHEHAFRIGWYEELGEPPGLDAAIFTPYNDLRFVNDTGGWLLIQSWVDLQRQRLTIALYGAPTGRTVEMSYRVLETTPAPRQPLYIDDPSLPRGSFKKTDVARGGIKVEVYRTVQQGDKTLQNDVFPTTFKPWPNIYVRGTGRR